RFHVDRSNLRTIGKTVCRDGPGDQRHQAADVDVVNAQYRHTVKRQVLDELKEGLAQFAKVVAVGFHVVGIDVGDHRQHRLQIKKRSVGLVRLHYDELAAAELGVGTGRFKAAADNESWIHVRCGKHARDQAGGRSFAMCAG